MGSAFGATGRSCCPSRRWSATAEEARIRSFASPAFARFAFFQAVCICNAITRAKAGQTGPNRCLTGDKVGEHAVLSKELWSAGSYILPANNNLCAMSDIDTQVVSALVGDTEFEPVTSCMSSRG